MQQKLAVASVLVLVLLAGASAILIQQHAFGQSQLSPASPSQSSHVPSATTGTNPTSAPSGGSLLTTAPHNQAALDDDGIELGDS